MKNLILLSSIEGTLHFNESILLTYMNTRSKILYLVTNKYNLYYYYLENTRVVLQKSLLESSTEQEEELFTLQDIPISLTYLSELDSLLIISNSGSLLLFNCNNCKTEMVGSVIGGILKAMWSPDQEILLIVTKAGREREKPTVMIMSKEWQLLNEFELLYNINEVELTWRGDAQYFSIILPYENKLTMMIYNRDGVLTATSEKIDNSKPIAVWRPSGNLIVALKDTDASKQLIFFERNGLQYSNFTLPDFINGYDVVKIDYSADSELLAVFCSNNSDSFILLYSFSNAHHYLTQVLRFNSPNNKISTFCFDSERSNIALISTSGTVAWISYVYSPVVSAGVRMLGTIDYLHSNQPSFIGHSFMDDGVSKDYDEVGPCIRLTNLGAALVPPPMSGIILPVSNPPNSIVFYGGDWIENKPRPFVVLDSVNVLSFYGHTGEEFNYDFIRPTFLGTIDLKTILNSDSFNLVRHIQWTTPSTVIFSVSKPSCSDLLYIIYTTPHINFSCELKLNTEFKTLELSIRSYRSFSFKSQYYIQMVSGQVFNINTFSLAQNSIGNFPSPCPNFCIFNHSNEQPHILGLDIHSKLYLGNYLVSPHCSSVNIPIHPYFLIFTTLNSLICLDIKTLIEGVMRNVSYSDLQSSHNVRAIERSGIIVAVVPNSERVVLYQPRGNFETIHPRILLLRTIQELLVLNPPAFKSAFDLIRLHRLDMNILFDHSPRVWRKNVQHFINALNDEDSLNLFISSLVADNVLAKLQLYHTIDPIDLEIQDGKINNICLLLREALIADKSKKFTLSILTTFVKQTPTDLESALQFVQQMRDNDSIASSTNALKYLIFLVDIQQLYKVALGIYDFDLAGIVAQQSQMDPKEYIPYLEGLKVKPPHQARYEIDISLSKWESALNNLSLGKEEFFQDCLNLVIDKKLYIHGLKLFPANTFPTEHNQILSLHATDLMNNKNFLHAAYSFRACGDLDNSMECFKQAGDWQSLIVICGQLGISTEDMQIFVMETAHILLAEHRYAEAATLFIEFEKDIDEGVALFCKAGCWVDAIQTIYRYGRSDLIDNGFLTALSEEWSNKRSQVANSEERIKYCFERLTVVRCMKAEKLQIEEDEEKLYDDTASLTSGMSTSSILSRYTMTSQISDYDSNASEIRRALKDQKKSKRIESKRSKKKIKEGHPLEEDFLVKQLLELAPSQVKLDVINNLCKVLTLLNYASLSSILLKEYNDFTLHYNELHLKFPNELICTKKVEEIKAPNSIINEIDFLKFEHLSFDANSVPKTDGIKFSSKYAETSGELFD